MTCTYKTPANRGTLKILYHRTNAADKILVEGFRDSTGNYMTTTEFTGVWLSDRPLNCNEGAKGDQLLQLEIPESLITEYEWVEEGKPYREFLVPAELVNGHGKPKLIEDCE